MLNYLTNQTLDEGRLTIFVPMHHKYSMLQC